MPKYNRRQKLKNQKRHKKRSKGLLALIFTAVVVILIGIILYIVFRLSALEKFIYVQKTPTGGAEVKLVDSENDRLYEVVFPPQTTLDLAYSLGEYKLDSSWVLGEKEGYRGDLIAKSLVKNFHLPVYLWADQNSSNLSLLQKIKVWMLQKGLSQMNKEQYLVKGDNLPFFVLLNFGNDRIVNQSVKVEIVDGSGYLGISTELSSVIEVMGGKVANYSKVASTDSDCRVGGINKKAVAEFAKVFDCQEIAVTGENIDVRLSIGKDFAQRY